MRPHEHYRALYSLTRIITSPRPIPWPGHFGSERFFGLRWNQCLLSSSLISSLVGPLCRFIFWTHFGTLLETILAPILDSIGPKKSQGKPKKTIRHFKDPKPCIFKNLKKPRFFVGFPMKKPPKKNSRSPKGLPRHTQKTPKPSKKNIQNQFEN